MKQTIDIDQLHCLCSSGSCKDKIAYILYPIDMLADWIESAAEKYGVTGSFWYEGFVDWIKNLTVTKKSGEGYFLLGEQESKSKVKSFSTVGTDTQEILKLLEDAGIDVEFQSVSGNHYSDPIPRLDKAFTALYSDIIRE